MEEMYRKKCYWGDCDLDKYWLNYYPTIELIDKIWNLDKEYVCNVLNGVFPDNRNMYNLSKEIIFNYLEGTYENDIMHKYMNDLLTCSKNNDLQWYQWEFLRRVFGTVNAQVYANFCRNRAQEIVLASNEEDDSLSLRKFTIAACYGDYKKCNESINSVDMEKMKSVWGTKRNAMLEYLDTIIKRERIQDEFGEYLKGKKVILSGPASREKELEALQKDEIGIKITYRGKEYLSEMEKKFTPNISFYNYEYSEKLFKEKQPFVDDLDYIVLKGECSNFYNLGIDNKVRVAHYLNFGCGFGYPNMAQVALYDLFHYTNRIYVENFDCYYNKKIYSEGYFVKKDEYKRDLDKKAHFLKGIVMHDLVGNWRLLKTWFEDKLFLCDERLREVLSLSENIYVEGIEKYNM